jgi:hypothetical protein
MSPAPSPQEKLVLDWRERKRKKASKQFFFFPAWLFVLYPSLSLSLYKSSFFLVASWSANWSKTKALINWVREGWATMGNPSFK